MCSVQTTESNNRGPRAWSKEQRKILHFCLRGLHEIFLKDRRFSLISTSRLLRELFSHGTYKMHCRKEGVLWRKGLEWRDGWCIAGNLGPDVGPTWWETLNRHCGVQKHMQPQLHHRLLRLPAGKEPEGMWLPEKAVRHGWQQQTQKEKMLWGNGNHGAFQAATRKAIVSENSLSSHIFIYLRGKWAMFSTIF